MNTKPVFSDKEVSLTLTKVSQIQPLVDLLCSASDDVKLIDGAENDTELRKKLHWLAIKVLSNGWNKD